ncbi:MAG: sporulation membrane protein YtaF [Defluviitaleaceae bacterium]|nr:sporulation membrane protein YtaF [Defluviitaleaceae bacterium]
MLIAVMEAGLIAGALSVDAFTAGFAYGSRKIKIPMRSVQVINIVCALITGLALFAGTLLKSYISSWLALGLAFSILFFIGVCRLLDSITKEIIRKHSDISKEIKLSLFNFKFILRLYADPEAADADSSKVISPAEAAALALSLSLDGIAVGFGAALANANGIAVVAWSLITNVAAVILGCRLGGKAADKLPFNISWVGGAVLIALAVSKLM